MGKNIYSLEQQEANSNEYYADVYRFTNRVRERAQRYVSSWLDELKYYVKIRTIEPLLTDNEYLLNFLMLGVFWNNYYHKAMHLNLVTKSLLVHLSKARSHPYMKVPADKLRSVLQTLCLEKEKQNDKLYTHYEVSKLLDWMLATDDFKEEAEQLKVWVKTLQLLSTKQYRGVIKAASRFASWFFKEGDMYLGKYTMGVDEFCRRNQRKYRWREDQIFCLRAKNEYYLNMIGAELLNEAYRKAFCETKERLLLLPGCMRIKPEDQCHAVNTRKGKRCMHCTKECNINRYATLEKRLGMKVYILSHQSDRFSKDKAYSDSIGIIGVACVLNLISGGLKARRMGLVPQCVLLDYCGCKKHWNQTGIMTDLNKERLIYTADVTIQELQ